MVRNIDIALIRAFVVVADHGAVTSAANALHLTQSAVSQQISRMEDLAGECLFVRKSRGVSLTLEGERLVGPARRMLMEHDRFSQTLATRGIEGRVRLGVPPDLVGSLLPPLIKSFCMDFPLIEVRLSSAPSPDLAAALSRGEIDLALVEGPPSSLDAEWLFTDQLVWIGAPGGRAYLCDPLPISMVSPKCAFRSMVLEALDGVGRTWRSRFETGSLEAVIGMAKSDLALMPFLACAVPADLEIISSSDLPQLPRIAIGLISKSKALGQASLEMSRHLRKALGEMLIAA